MTKDAIVCEDLGTLTNPVAAVMKKYELLGMRLTQFTVPTEPDDPYRCKNITENVGQWLELTIINLLKMGKINDKHPRRIFTRKKSC